MTWITLAVTLLTVIVAPLLGWLFKYLAEKKASDDAAKKVAEAQAASAKENDERTSTLAGTVNDSITKQKIAREEWLKSQPDVTSSYSNE